MESELNTAISALAKKLQIKPGTKWLIVNAPQQYEEILEPLPANASISTIPDGEFQGIQLFVQNSGQMADDLNLIASLLKKDTIFWVCYPKKSSGIKTDLEMTGNWDVAARYGLTTVAAISINEIWTGVRLKPTAELKPSEVRNDAIKQNDYAQYIDPEKKTVTLPPDLKEALEKEVIALANYTALSYSNRKEYIIWILTAKQEKTRMERIVKAIEKLQAGKKNPSEK